MKQKILFFEYLIAIFFSLQSLFPHIFTQSASIITYLSLLHLKYKYEGLRLTVLAYTFIQIGLLLSPSPLANMALSLMTYLVITYFPVYEFPEALGPFKVGYKDLTLQNSLYVSVFYPTLETTSKGLYKTSENGWVRIYDIMRSYPGHFIPKVIYKIAFEFLEYLDIGVNHNANIISPELLGHTEKFPVIVFSHGLSANRNLYTGFARQWASYGYIVFCIDHEEEIYLEFSNWENFKQQRRVHLDARCESISHTIDFIQNSKEIKNFFQTNSVEIDFERISLAGHSFGSAAVTEYCAKDSRVTGALVLLDPWLFPASDEALNTPARRPVLVIRSESFESVFEEFKVKERIQSVVRANKEFCDETLSCYFKNTTHNSFCDLIVHMPREMKLFGIIDDPKEVEGICNSQTMLSQIFLDLMLYSGKAGKFGSKKEMVLKAFESYAAGTGGKSQLEIDSF